MAISRFASTIYGLYGGMLAEDEFEAIVERDVVEGQHRNPTGRFGWFTTAYFHLPGELREEAKQAGLDVEGLFAIEGPATNVPDLDAWLEDPARRTNTPLLHERAEDPGSKIVRCR